MDHPENLLKPHRCGPMQLKNRLAAGPIVTGHEYDTDIGKLSQFMTAVARDGVAMAVVCAGLVSKRGRPFPGAVPFDSTVALRHQNITKALHEQDCKAVLQLIHVGSQARARWPLSPMGGTVDQKPTSSGARRHAWAPAVPCRLNQAVADYARAASAARMAGYDAVEIAASGTMLPAEFLSPATNRRRDSWGATRLERFKLLTDIVSDVRKAVGGGLAVGLRLNLMELLPDGAAWDETLRLIQDVRRSGVDYFCADFGAPGCPIPGRTFDMPAGVWTPAYEELARATEQTVVFGRNWGTLADADALAGRHANAVFEITEQYLADTCWLQKTLGADPEPILPWIDLDTDYPSDDVFRASPPRNLAALVSGPDPMPMRIKPDPQPRNITVIGAGPAGIHFSLIAAGRGHRVRLLEQSGRIGGSLHGIAKAHDSEAIRNWIRILQNKLQMSTVDVKLSTKADVSTLLDTDDLVVIATGTQSSIPDISGIESSNVMTFEELIEEDRPVGNRVAVIGANRMSLTVCRQLLDHNREKLLAADVWRRAWGVGDIKDNRGGVLGFIPGIDPSPRRVYLIETHPGDIARLKHSPDLKWNWTWLLMNGMRSMENVNIEAVDNFAVRLSHGPRRTGRSVERIDHVVLCTDLTAADEFSGPLGEHRRKFLRIGSAQRPRGFMSLETSILQAVQTAWTV